MTAYASILRWCVISVSTAGLLACQDKRSPEVVQGSLDAEVMIDENITADDLTTENMPISQKAAMDLFVFQEGDWASEWVYYDAEGKESGQLSGTETFSFLVDRHSQMLTNVIPSVKHTSYAMLAYSPAEEHIIFLNIGPKGDYWVMRQNPVTGVMISDPHINTDGSETIQMFTYLSRSQNEFEILMESSSDGGQTWRKGYVQKLKRIVYAD